MCRIPGGTFVMGSDDFYPEERPARTECVSEFGIMQDAVSNLNFAAFVSATGYVTTAERVLDPCLTPDADTEDLAPASLVFTPSNGPVDLRDFHNWWTLVPGACWKHPEGPSSGISDRMDHPVVHVSLSDARAFADWAELRLPCEKEWEYAAHGGDDSLYPWGDSLGLVDV